MEAEGLLCLSCALGPGNWKGRKALEKEEGPWEETGTLGRRRGPGAAYSALTYAHQGGLRRSQEP